MCGTEPQTLSQGSGTGAGRGDTVPPSRRSPTSTVPTAVTAGTDILPRLRGLGKDCMGGISAPPAKRQPLAAGAAVPVVDTAANSPQHPGVGYRQPWPGCGSSHWGHSAGTYPSITFWGSLPAAWLHHRWLFKHTKNKHRYISATPGTPSSPSHGGDSGLRAGCAPSSMCPRAGGGTQHVTGVFSQAP